jgi:3-oxoacyl-[acyl-carrier protein] reductase
MSVVTCYSQENEDVASLATELEGFGNGNYLMQADVSDADAVSRLAESVRQRFGNIEVLVNNASVISHLTLDEMDLSEWKRILDTNLTSLYLVTHATLNLITDGGSIITIGSNLASVGMRGRTHYTAAKAGVIGFTRSLCKEVGDRAIRANVISPGLIQTQQISNLSSEQQTRYVYLSALHRLGQPEDIASTVLFLASDLSRFISGSIITVDGGLGGVSVV